MAAGKSCGKVRGDDAWVWALFLAIFTVVSFVGPGSAVAIEIEDRGGADGEIEKLLVQGLELIGQNRIEEARGSIQSLVSMRPDFRLANVVLGDLLMMRAGKVTRFGQGVVGYEKELGDLLAEARVRLDNEKRPPPSELPGELLRIPSRYRHVLVVDLSRSRLYLFRNWQSIPEKVSDFYIAIGKAGGGKEVQGDKKTPIGFYRVTSRVDGRTLPPFYGAGALPLDYPNEWDQLYRRTGGGIWLHGSPAGTYSRPPRASDGCVVLTNPDFKVVEKLLDIGYPVILTQSIEWLPPDEWWRRREQMIQRVYQWRDDWRRLSGDVVLRHYSSRYRSGRVDDGLWNSLADGAVDLKDPGLMGYPGKEPMIVVTWDGWKGVGGRGVPMIQFWHLEEDSDWKIVFEPNG